MSDNPSNAAERATLAQSTEAQPTKVELRHALRALREKVVGDERARASERAALALMHWETIAGARRVAVFSSLADEIDTAPLIHALRTRGIEIALPRIERGKTSLVFALVAGAEELVAGPFGLLEPRGPGVQVASLDVVVVPGLGFDRFGGRLGYGVGYYDRALAGYRGACVGYGYAFQLLSATLPQAPHDVRVTAVAHDQGLVMCEPGR